MFRHNKLACYDLNFQKVSFSFIDFFWTDILSVLLCRLVLFCKDTNFFSYSKEKVMRSVINYQQADQWVANWCVWRWKLVV